jgi:hypothetical protein
VDHRERRRTMRRVGAEVAEKVPLDCDFLKTPTPMLAFARIDPEGRIGRLNANRPRTPDQEPAGDLF